MGILFSESGKEKEDGMKIYFAGEPGGNKEDGEKRIILRGGHYRLGSYFYFKEFLLLLKIWKNKL